MRALYLGSLQRLQRRCASSLFSICTLFFALSLLLRALNSYRVASCLLLLIVNIPSYYSRFLLYNLRCIAALSAT
jgi:hypothetical protein